MLDAIIGRHTWNFWICTDIHTEIHTHTHTHKKNHKKNAKSEKKKRRCNDSQQITVTHLGENKRLHLESSKRNYFIVF